MNKSSKLSSCLISTLMICSLCYGEWKHQAPEEPKKTFTGSVKEYFGIKKGISPEEKAQKKFEGIPAQSKQMLAESLARKEQAKVTAAQAKVTIAQAKVAQISTNPSIFDSIKSVFGFGAKNELATAQKKLSSSQAKLNVCKSLNLESTNKKLESLKDDLDKVEKEIKNAWTKAEIAFVNEAIDDIVKKEKNKSSDIDDIVGKATLDKAQLKKITPWKGPAMAITPEMYEKRFKELLKIKLQIAQQESTQAKK